jgi:F0F1-type ATP synthase membrane subunit b/b'
MGHPAIDEFCRINSLGNFRPETFRRMQRVFRDEINPRLDERDRLVAESEQSKKQYAAEIAGLTAQIEELEAALAEARSDAKEARASAKGKTPHSA